MAIINGEYISNPYRYGTKMHKVFQLFSDGMCHTPGEVVPIVKSTLSPPNSANKRTATSFIRTLREKFTVTLNSFGEYRLAGRA